LNQGGEKESFQTKASPRGKFRKKGAGLQGKKTKLQVETVTAPGMSKLNVTTEKSRKLNMREGSGKILEGEKRRVLQKI